MAFIKSLTDTKTIKCKETYTISTTYRWVSWTLINMSIKIFLLYKLMKQGYFDLNQGFEKGTFRNGTRCDNIDHLMFTINEYISQSITY